MDIPTLTAPPPTPIHVVQARSFARQIAALCDPDPDVAAFLDACGLTPDRVEAMRRLEQITAFAFGFQCAAQATTPASARATRAAAHREGLPVLGGGR